MDPRAVGETSPQRAGLTVEAVESGVRSVSISGGGEPLVGTVEDTAELNGQNGYVVPNERYFTAQKMWPVFKNYRLVEGGFDNAFFHVDTKD